MLFYIACNVYVCLNRIGRLLCHRCYAQGETIRELRCTCLKGVPHLRFEDTNEIQGKNKIKATTLPQ